MNNCWLCDWYTWLGNRYGCGLGGCRNYERFEPSRNGNVVCVCVGGKEQDDAEQ